MSNPATLPTNKHYNLKPEQKAELHGRVKEAYQRVPQTTISTGNAKCKIDSKKTAPVSDWWKK